jgi:hypothetical protein
MNTIATNRFFFRFLCNPVARGRFGQGSSPLARLPTVALDRIFPAPPHFATMEAEEKWQVQQQPRPPRFL